MQARRKCTHGCGGYLHEDFCGVQEKKKRYLNNSDIMIPMCQKCAATLGKTELTHKPPTDTEYEEPDSEEEEDTNDRPMHSSHLNIISFNGKYCNNIQCKSKMIFIFQFRILQE